MEQPIIGTLVDDHIRWLIENKGMVENFDPNEVQPSSLDLRLGDKAFVMDASRVFFKTNLQNILDEHAIRTVDISEPQSFKTNEIVIVPLQERLNLPSNIRGETNPKSSTGRIDVFARVLTNGSSLYDSAPYGYKGGLFLEVIPKSFNTTLVKDLTLTQLRLFAKDATLSQTNIIDYHNKYTILRDLDDKRIELPYFRDNDLCLSLSLRPLDNNSNIIGYKSKKTLDDTILDLSKRTNKASEFFEPIYYDPKELIRLEKDTFYLFASNQKIYIPPELSAEVVDYDTKIGELRTHYAGFIDPGFNSYIVLEVRARDTPLIIRHNQPFFRVKFYKNSKIPGKVYGDDLGSHYQGQTLKLSKYLENDHKET